MFSLKGKTRLQWIQIPNEKYCKRNRQNASNETGGTRWRKRGKGWIVVGIPFFFICLCATFRMNQREADYTWMFPLKVQCILFIGLELNVEIQDPDQAEHADLEVFCVHYGYFPFPIRFILITDIFIRFWHTNKPYFLNFPWISFWLTTCLRGTKF